MVSNLAVFPLATYLATFQKIGRFFPNHLVTLFAGNERSSLFFGKKSFIKLISGL
jgi:hypothetical protein